MKMGMAALTSDKVGLHNKHYMEQRQKYRVHRWPLFQILAGSSPSCTLLDFWTQISHHLTAQPLLCYVGKLAGHDLG